MKYASLTKAKIKHEVSGSHRSRSKAWSGSSP